MKCLKIIIKNDMDTNNRLEERGFFSDDPQFLFNAIMVLKSGRHFILDHKIHDMDKTEEFLAIEDIPYTRILGEN